MPKKQVILGIAQMRESSDIGRNLREIADFCVRARRTGAEILCFPECAVTGYGPWYHESPAAFDPDMVDAAIMEVRATARDMRLVLIAGAHVSVNGGWLNTAFVLGSNGRLLTRYDKAHLYHSDLEFYSAGTKRPEVASARGVRLGLQICFDVRFPEPFRLLSLAGAQVIAVPSHIHGKRDMWKGPVIEAHVRSRAAENGRYVVFVNAAGPEQNVASMVANPQGEVIARCRRASRQLLLAKLDLSKVNDDLLRSRRTDLYSVQERGACQGSRRRP